VDGDSFRGARGPPAHTSRPPRHSRGAVAYTVATGLTRDLTLLRQLRITAPRHVKTLWRPRGGGSVITRTSGPDGVFGRDTWPFAPSPEASRGGNRASVLETDRVPCADGPADAASVAPARVDGDNPVRRTVPDGAELAHAHALSATVALRGIDRRQIGLFFGKKHQVGRQVTVGRFGSDCLAMGYVRNGPVLKTSVAARFPWVRTTASTVPTELIVPETPFSRACGIFPQRPDAVCPGRSRTPDRALEARS